MSWYVGVARLLALSVLVTSTSNARDAAQILLGYPVQNVGCCKIILHPQWRSRIYPATLFTTAPASVLRAALVGSVLPVGTAVELLQAPSASPAAASSSTTRSCVFATGVVSRLKLSVQSEGDGTNAEGGGGQPASRTRWAQRAVVDLDWVMADGKCAQAFVGLDVLQVAGAVHDR